MSTGLFRVMKASAGSGKTYSLVREYLVLALGTPGPWYYRHILAITFTNAAAAEMKKRVLSTLSEISTGKPVGMLTDLTDRTGLTNEELRQRAGLTFSHMLHNYGELSILTIDSFTHRVIRSFARDLNLGYDFRIEIDSEAFIEKLVDSCFELVGEDDELSSYIRQFTLENLEEETGWDIRRELRSFAKLLLREDSGAILTGLPLPRFIEIRKMLVNKQKEYEQSLISLANKAIDLIYSNGLDAQDFYHGRGGGINAFKKISEGDFSRPSGRFFELMEKEEWVSTGKTSGQEKHLIARLKPQLLEIMKQIAHLTDAEHSGKYKMRGLVAKNIYSMGLLVKLHELSVEVRREENILLISDFHKIVNEIVIENDAPFIYERIGNRYRHILIDEFQDTSSLQWANAMPLIENGLGENNSSLLVGDAKQSIYRWRGGNATQFTDLPSLEPIHRNRRGDFLQPHFFSQDLKTNFRSRKCIVGFNNRFYEMLVRGLDLAGHVYRGHLQEPVRDLEGYVRIDRIQGKNNEERWPLTSARILAAVRESLAAGYSLSDIVILTRKGEKDAGPIAAFLSGSGYEVITQDSFLLANSPKVRVIVNCIATLLDPKGFAAHIALVDALSEVDNRITLPAFISRHEILHGKLVETNLENFLEPHYGKLPGIIDDAYETVIGIARYFGLSIDNYLEMLLGNVRERCIQRNSSLHEFYDWWLRMKDKLYVSSMSGVNAIRIMTVHKSKGLQFPVVIYPRFATSDRSNYIWVKLDEKEMGLPAAIVSSASTGDGSIQWPPEFYDEEEKSRLDDINLCYVATTRAEDRLYMIQETGGNNSWLSKNISGLLDKDLNEWKIGDAWEYGTPEPSDRKNYEEEVQLTPGIVHQQSPVLKLLPVKWSSEDTRFGELVHTCLSILDDASNADKAIKAAGLIHGVKELTGLERVVTLVLADGLARRWFDGNVVTLNERDLYAAPGRIIRPDRVVVDDNVIEVIDYKTGQPRPSHEVQVKEYMECLQAIYSKPVKGYLLYTYGEKVEIREVG